jgi:hypothetical protein
MHHRALVVTVALCLVVPTVTHPPAAAAGPPPSEYQPPVQAPVVDPFRPPASRFGPGNRGLEYGTAPGTEVRAAADGVVTFAGLVAGTRHVTVLHPDGLRTTYSFLDRVDVVVGQRVEQGEVVGTTSGHLHLGVRAGDSYLDPASLFGDRPPHVELVPFDEPPGRGARGERSAIGQLVGGLGGLAGNLAEGAADRVLQSSGATVDWLRDNGDQLLRTAAHYLEPQQLRLLRRGLAVWTRANAVASRPCTSPSVPPAPPPTARRVAVTVAGLGSTSRGGAIDDVDLAALGYDTADVVRFSYNGGRTPATGDAFRSIPASGYAAGDTQHDLRGSASRLADLIEQVADRAPGATIDLYAHSQGGVVARLALLELDRRHGAGWTDRLGLVAMLATPNGGSDLATAVHGIGSTERGSQVFDALGLVVGLDDDAAQAAQLAETSDLIEELATSPLPQGVDAVTIAARGDLVVPVPRTAAPGATQVVIPLDGPSAHGAVPGSPATQRELALALAGMPPTCQSFRGALVDGLVGEGISWGEDQLGSLAWLGAIRFGGKPLGG